MKWNKAHKLSGTAFLLFLSILAGAQNRKVILSGYVRDAESGEPLPQAVVYTADKKYGIAADAVGFYSLQLQPGSQTICCAYFGYQTEELTLDVQKATKWDFHLRTDRNELDAATVFSRSKREEIRLPQMGLERVDASLVQRLPALMGEADIIRVIQMMPGVQTPSEGSTGFSVRGGGIDQNLILMDGAPIYNCGHFLGFLSMFNGDAIRGADLYKGDFPASYGGRISSVLDISTKDGNNRRFGGNASIGLITSKLFLEGPIVPGKLSFLLSGRRTYLDIFFPLLGERIPDNTRMYFYDLNAKLSWIAGEKDRVYLSAFSGRDVFGFSMEEFDLGDVITLEAFTLDKAYFDFLFSITMSSFSIPIFSPQPANAPTNIRGEHVLGWFAACPVTSAEVVVDNPFRPFYKRMLPSPHTLP